MASKINDIFSEYKKELNSNKRKKNFPLKEPVEEIDYENTKVSRYLSDEQVKRNKDRLSNDLDGFDKEAIEELKELEKSQSDKDFQSTLTDSFIVSNITYASFESFESFKEFIKDEEDFKNMDDLELKRQFLIFLNSPRKFNEETNELEVKFFEKVFKIKTKKGFKENNDDFSKDIDKFEDIITEEDYLNKLIEEGNIPEDEMELGFEITHLVSSRLLFLTSHTIVDVVSPELKGEAGPQIITFKKFDTNKLHVGFRGTYNARDAKEDLLMGMGVKTPTYFRQLIEYLNENAFEKDENGEFLLKGNSRVLKKDWQNVEFNGHSLGGSLATFASAYLYSEALTFDPQTGKEFNNVAQTFNAADISRLLEINNVTSNLSDIINYRLLNQSGDPEILSYFAQQETGNNPFQNIDLISFRDSLNMLKGHKSEEIYYSIIIYEKLLEATPFEEVQQITKNIIKHFETNEILSILVYLAQHPSLDLNDVLNLPAEEKQNIIDTEYSMEETLKIISDIEIEEPSNKTLEYIKNKTLDVLSKITVRTLGSAVVLGANFFSQLGKKTLGKKPKKKGLMGTVA
jgi:hypothetical protein